MVDFAKELLGGVSQQVEEDEKEKTRPLTVDFASELLSGQKKPEQFLELKKTPKVISSPEMGADVLTSFIGGIPTNKQSAIKYFAEKRGIPESRYTVVDGEIAYQGDDGKWYKEISGPASTAAYYAPDVLEAAPTIATGITLAPTSPFVAAPTTAAVGSAANLVRQQIGRGISGQEISPGQVALSGLLSGAPELVPSGARAVAERKLVRDIAEYEAPQVAELLAKAQQQGIELTPAEISNLASLMGQQKVLGNIPASSRQMQKFYEKREVQQVAPAVNKFLESISKVGEPEVAGKMGQEALEKAKLDLIGSRDVAVEPLFRKAFERSVPVDVNPIIRQINGKLKIAKGAEKKSLQRIKGNLYKEVPAVDEAGEQILDAAGNPVMRSVPEDRLPALQRAKFDLDAMFKEDAFTSMDKVLQKDLTQLQQDLVSAMGKDNPAYLEANAKFAEMSAPIEEFGKRRAGASLATMSQDNLNQFSQRLFADNSIDAIRYAREQIESVNPDAWAAVVRSHLEQQWQKAGKPSARQKGMKLDAGATWSNMLLGDLNSQRALATAMPKEQFQALRDLTQVLDAAGRVPKLGSDTAFNAEILKQMRADASADPIALAAGGVGTLLSPQKWGERITDWATERRFYNDAEKLAKIITSPDGINKLKELRQLPATSAKRWAGLAQLLTQYGVLEAKE